jgi:cytochrome c553
MRSTLILSLCVSVLCLSGRAAAEGSAEAGQAKSATCVACHGADGNSVNPEWPSIAGQHASYLEKQLHMFKSGARQNVLMSPMASGLSDEDIADLAAYYAAQPHTGLEADPGRRGC